MTIRHPWLTLNDGTLPGRDTVRGGVFLSSGLGQHWDGTSAQAASLLGHLVISGVEIFLSLPQSLLQEGRVASTTGPSSNGWNKVVMVNIPKFKARRTERTKYNCWLSVYHLFTLPPLNPETQITAVTWELWFEFLFFHLLNLHSFLGWGRHWGRVVSSLLLLLLHDNFSLLLAHICTFLKSRPSSWIFENITVHCITITAQITRWPWPAPMLQTIWPR